MSIEIGLSAGDIAFASTEASSRFYYDRMLKAEFKGMGGSWVEQLGLEISGCLGEIAVGRWLDRYPFSLFKERKQGDVGEFEVRATGHATGRLLISPDDNSERKYLLVTIPTWEKAIIHGWMWGYEAKDAKYWNTHMPKPVFAVGQQFLHDPSSLLK